MGKGCYIVGCVEDILPKTNKLLIASALLVFRASLIYGFSQYYKGFNPCRIHESMSVQFSIYFGLDSLIGRWKL
jgi:hypothetical protein